MKHSMIAILLALSTTPAFAGRSNRGAPVQTPPPVAAPVNLDQYMAGIPSLLQRIQALPQGPQRDANIVYALGTLFNGLTPMVTSLETTHADVIKANALAFANVYNALKVVPSVVPADNPAVLNAHAAMADSVSKMQDLDAATTNLTASIANLQKNFAGARQTVIARNQSNAVAAAAETVFGAGDQLIADLSQLASYERACMGELANTKLAVFTSGTNAKADALLERVRTNCILQQPSVDPASFTRLQAELQAAIQSLSSNYQILN